MKISETWLVSILLVALPIIASAQSNIVSAFDAIIKCPQAKVTENHTLEKDPSTNVKIGQSDVYRFELPANEFNLVNNVLSAFQKDSETAYSFNKGKSSLLDSAISLTVGDGSQMAVRVNEPESDYVCALFLAPRSEDSEGIYRYAYAFNYKEENGKLLGYLIVTYATTLKHRQQLEQESQRNALLNISNESFVIPSIDSSQKTWFEEVIYYLQGIRSASSQTRIALAAKAFKTIGNRADYQDSNLADKDAVCEILKNMISDKKYSETMLNTILNQCLKILK